MLPEADSKPTKPQSKRYMWLIPLVMMAIAILACDDVYIPPPMIDRVEADKEAAGTVYVTVKNVGVTYSNGDLTEGQTIAYESADYGESWQPSEHRFSDKPANSNDFEFYGEQLLLNGYVIWSFPRPFFRGIFYGDASSSTIPRFELPQDKVGNSAQGNTVYIGMGTQGVLVAYLDGNGFAPDWKIRTQGIEALQALPLNFTQPASILSIILLILIVPPFALIHAYLLQRVWLYVLSPAEARSTALKVTAGLVVLAIIGIIFWLTSDRIDLYEVIGVLTVITVIVGVTTTVLLAQKAKVTDATRMKLAGAALVVSLIVPGGVAALFALWWLVFGIVFIYWAYQRVYRRFIDIDGVTPESRLQRWRVDRLAIEMVMIIALGSVTIIFEVGLLQAFLNRAIGNTGLIELLSLALGIGGLFFVIRHYSSQRAKAILKLTDETLPKRELRLMSGDLWKHTVYWIILTGVASAATLFGQMMAYTWFTSLLKTTISRG